MTMPFVIHDGHGKGFSAQVDSELRLRVFATTRSAAENATFDGDSYNLNTGIVNLTNTADTPVLYLKNNENRNLHIQTIVIILGTSTNGSGDCQVTVIRNPTGGTIITDTPTDIAISENRNFGSSNELAADQFVGAIGDTLTGGADYIPTIMQTPDRLPLDIDTIIPKGKTIGIKIQPPAGNTDMDVIVEFVCRLENGDA